MDAPHTVGRWVTDRARLHPHAIAIDDRGVQLDYATLGARSQQLADRFAAAGYGPGQRIATVSGNSADHVVAFFACALLGLALVPLSWRLTPAELASLIARTDAALLLVEDEHRALATAATALLDDAPVSAELGMAGVEQFVPEAQERAPRRAVRDDDPLLIVFTSGSEAAPKGVVLTHANCFWNNHALGQALPMRDSDVVLSILPQFHAAAWNVQPLLAWRSGATVVLERSFQPGRVLQLIQERGVTTMMGVPTQYQLLADAAQWEATDLSSLRHALVGGATMPQVLAERWAERGVPLTQGYGLTEAGPNVLHLGADALRAHPGAVGVPYPTVEVQVVDPLTELPMEAAATGELWVRGPSVSRGYWQDDAATNRAFRGEWLRTGDMVSRDDAGIYRIVDRLKEIFVSGGENVSPAEVEAVLREHPLIEDCAVVGIADPLWGERGAAFIVASVPVGADEVLQFARERLAAYKLPVAVHILDDLPRATIEKVDRSRLREIAQSQSAMKERVDERQ